MSPIFVEPLIILEACTPELFSREGSGEGGYDDLNNSGRRSQPTCPTLRQEEPSHHRLRWSDSDLVIPIRGSRSMLTRCRADVSTTSADGFSGGGWEVEETVYHSSGVNSVHEV
ncbi:hypothetical protein F0562_015666 [Nyssa sinensis]|uniref:Uncharacterized protein n=1 Tax=Nyssa sinensis TaxID=561372 RepID=A0A5J4ZKZ2_9ASTE|nr:hypothetical protein F0562_015666 [Nyssa sinensis]